MGPALHGRPFTVAVTFRRRVTHVASCRHGRGVWGVARGPRSKTPSVVAPHCAPRPPLHRLGLGLGTRERGPWWVPTCRPDPRSLLGVPRCVRRPVALVRVGVLRPRWVRGSPTTDVRTAGVERGRTARTGGNPDSRPQRTFRHGCPHVPSLNSVPPLPRVHTTL